MHHYLEERRKSTDRRQNRAAAAPYLTKDGWIHRDRRQMADRRQFDLQSLLQGEIEEIEIKPV